MGICLFPRLTHFAITSLLTENIRESCSLVVNELDVVQIRSLVEFNTDAYELCIRVFLYIAILVGEGNKEYIYIYIIMYMINKACK